MAEEGKPLLGIFLGALSGGAVAALVTGLFNQHLQSGQSAADQRLENQKFAYSVIQQAVQSKDASARLESLDFLVEIGCIPDGDIKTRVLAKIAEAKKDPKNPTIIPQVLPSMPATVVASGPKEALLHFESRTGIPEEKSEAFKRAVRRLGYRVESEDSTYTGGNASEIVFHPRDKGRADEINALLSGNGFPAFALRPMPEVQEGNVYIYNAN